VLFVSNPKLLPKLFRYSTLFLFSFCEIKNTRTRTFKKRFIREKGREWERELFLFLFLFFFFISLSRERR
jgi:hypothetical protein